MVLQSPEQCDSTKQANPTQGNESTPVEVKTEDVPGSHAEGYTDVKEGSGPDTAPNGSIQSPGRQNALSRLRHILTWVPKNCRYDPNEPPKFNLPLNLLFAVVRFRLPAQRHMCGWPVNFTHCAGRHGHRGELVLRSANPVQDRSNI